MASEEGPLDDVRAELLRLLKQDDWRITESARRDGRKLKINRDRQEEVWVLSFHVSIHRGG